MERKEISEQIGELNLKIFSANKELEEMELNIRKKKIEIRRYKNEVTGLQLMLEEIDIERWKEKRKEKKEIKRNNIVIMWQEMYYHIMIEHKGELMKIK